MLQTCNVPRNTVCAHNYVVYYFVIGLLSIHCGSQWFIYTYSSSLLDWLRGNHITSIILITKPSYLNNGDLFTCRDCLFAGTAMKHLQKKPWWPLSWNHNFSLVKPQSCFVLCILHAVTLQPRGTCVTFYIHVKEVRSRGSEKSRDINKGPAWLSGTESVWWVWACHRLKKSV